MARNRVLKKKIDGYLRKAQLRKSPDCRKLVNLFVAKARKNSTVANLLFAISEKGKLQNTLALASGFEMYDWVIAVSYYAMYLSALAALAARGFKSRSHAATICALEYFYVHGGKLAAKHLDRFTHARTLSAALLQKLQQTKTRRETAQYEAAPAISRASATGALADAEAFISRVEEILAAEMHE